MSGTAAANSTALSPAKFVAAVSLLSNMGQADGPMARLFTLPDTRSALDIFGRLHGGDDGTLAVCSEAHLVAAHWFGTVRPGAVAAIDAMSHYATLASAACGTLQALLEKEDADATARQQAVALVESLEGPAVAQSQTWAGLAAEMISINSRMQIVVPQVVKLDQQCNIWGLDPYESQGPMESGLIGSLSATYQQLQGAWGAFGDDAAAVATALTQDVENAPEIIAQLGLVEAQNAWTQLSADMANTLPGPTLISSVSFSTPFGWFRLGMGDSGDLTLDLGLQAGPGDTVGLGPRAGDSVQMERLPGDQCGYFRLQLKSTGKYLTGLATNRLAQGDWADLDSQKWRPFLSGQQSMAKGTIEGSYLIQRTTGLVAAADMTTASLPLQPTGTPVELVQQSGVQFPRGSAVFQIPDLPFGS